MLLGELALDGRVRPVKAVLPAVLAAKREGGVAGRRRTALFAVVGCATFTSEAGRRGWLWDRRAAVRHPTHRGGC